MAADKAVSTEATSTLCNDLWGRKLSSTKYQAGDHVIPFESLLPTPSSLVEMYVDAKFDFALHELIQLLLVTNCADHVISLLDAKLLEATHKFGFGDSSFTIMHLACAVGAKSVVHKLNQDGRVFSIKDNEGCTPINVCFNGDVMGSLPAMKKWFHKSPHTKHAQPLREVKRKEIFELAKQPTNFYRLIVELQRYSFNVNNDQNGSGDLLVHIATSGGLPCLPLLFFLVVTMDANINIHNNEGITPLCLACRCGYEKVAEAMICVLGAGINVTDHCKRTPLHYAAKYGHANVATMLLRRGVDGGREDHTGRVAEMLAWQCREMECVQIIRKHMSERCAQLCQLIRENNLDMNSLFPSDYCMVNDEGYTLLMVAVQCNNKVAVQQLLLNDQCPKNFVHYPSKKTVVTIAAELSNVECLKALLDAGCYPHIRNSDDRLAIHYAASNKSSLCVELITRLPSGNGLKGLHLARQLADSDKEILRILDAAQVQRQEKVVTPHLFNAGIYGDKECTLFHILEDGDDVNPTNKDGEWPLLVATKLCHYHIVKLLCERGGHVTRPHTQTKELPLHIASKAGRHDIVELLLHYGSDQLSPEMHVKERTSSGATPLELAANQGHAKVVELLLRNGACTALLDSSGMSLLHSPLYPGVQFRLDQDRRTNTERIVQALQKRVSLKEFRTVWKGPQYHNYRDRHGDTMVMVAVSSNAKNEVLEFLLKSAEDSKEGLLMTSQPNTSVTSQTNSFEDSGLHHDVTGDKVRPSSTRDFHDRHLERRSLSVVPENYSGVATGRMDRDTSCDRDSVLKIRNLLNGYTALHKAVKANNLSAVKLLLQYDNSCADCQDHHGNTPLHLACSQQASQKLVQELMVHTDLMIRNDDQKLAEELCLSDKTKRQIIARREAANELSDNSSKQSSYYDDLPPILSDTNTNPFDTHRDNMPLKPLEEQLQQLKK
ncbi:CARD- and ANK-domain containing inflammasome adapter protein-like [Dysidea avara]|uniref:CARD- and ANK-domain containing inflammasome adapter protein-like n=1 Tax=Dysidea avara TaxID=196820 RepID=UPI003320F7AF